MVQGKLSKRVEKEVTKLAEEIKKPRLCEVLGVEVGEEFRFKGSNPKTYYIGENGVMYCEEEGGYAVSYIVCYAINRPEQIIHNRLIESEIAICKAVGAKWVSMDNCQNAYLVFVEA